MSVLLHCPALPRVTCSRPLSLVAIITLGLTTVGAQQQQDSRFAATQSLLQEHVEAKKIAGAVAIVAQRDRIVFHSETGWQDVAEKKPMTRRTLFRLASMTKPITSVAVMMLVEDGSLKLTDPLEKFVPQFAEARVTFPATDRTNDPQPLARPITIHDLLTHTSGLTYAFFGQQPHASQYRKAGICEGLVESSLTLAENTRRLAEMPLVGQPGSQWQYGLSTDVLGRVVEVVSGQPFDEFIEQKILKPLKMNDTHFVVPAEKLPRLATLYRPREDESIEAVDRGVHHAAGVTYSSTYQHPLSSNYRSGGAGLVSTADDYLRFLRMLLGGGELDGVRLLSNETIKQMTTNQIGELSILFPVHGDRFGYGFGIHSPGSQMSNGASPGTYSWGGVFHTYFWVDPEHEVIGVLMTQLFPFQHLSLWGDFQQHVYDALEQAIDGGKAAGPAAGEVYREFAIHNAGNLNWRVTDPRATATGAREFLPNPRLQLEVSDLDHAVRAEAMIDRWGGHLKTTDKRVRFNGNTWLRVPELETTPPGRGEYYYSQDNPVINVPLDHLHEGINTLEGTCATLEGYNWGQWGLYSLILRVYYDEAKKPANACTITAPTSGAIFPDNPIVRVEAPQDTERVEVLAFYDGDDEDGDGRFRDWHGGNHSLARGAPADLGGHVGTDQIGPFEIRWDTTWVADQQPKSIRIIARAKSRDGLWTVSEPVNELTLQRTSHHVAMVHATEVPEQFGVRAGREASCTLDIPDNIPLDKTSEARLSLRTWHGWDGHHQPLRINDHSFPIQGNNHHYDFDLLPIPSSSLKHGKNTFTIRSDTEHHMLEVLWPGPQLLVRYFVGQAIADPTPDAASNARLKKYEQFALTHAGDARHGRQIFADAKTKCGACHRVGKEGGDIGPDLTSIGGKFDRPHLIESLLEPSRQIVEGYRSSIIATSDGRVLSGVVRQQNGSTVTMGDAQGNLIKLSVRDIADRQESDVSVMPEGLTDSFTQQQFTDLIAYLETLRGGAPDKPGSAIAGPVNLPAGFTIETVLTGLTGATAMETLPDGRLLLCEQTGAVRVVENDRLLPQPLVTLPVDSNWERGVIGVTIDPDFPAKPLVYVCWVAEKPYPHHRISRFEVDGNVANSGSELVLLEGDDQRKLGGKVPSGHQGGALHFGSDGCLYVGIGEQTAGTPSQQLDSLLGKMLRIHRDGTIPRDNPLLDKTTGKYRAIWRWDCVTRSRLPLMPTVDGC